MKQLDHCFVSKQGFKNVDSSFTVSKQSLKKVDSCFMFRNEKQKNETSVSKQLIHCQSLNLLVKKCCIGNFQARLAKVVLDLK